MQMSQLGVHGWYMEEGQATYLLYIVNTLNLGAHCSRVVLIIFRNSCKVRTETRFEEIFQ